MPDDIAYETEKVTPNIISTKLKDLLRRNNLTIKKNNPTILGIPPAQSIIKYLITLEMDQNELSSTLELEAKKLLAGAKSDVVIDFKILGKNKTELDKIDVLLFATTQNEIKRLNNI